MASPRIAATAANDENQPVVVNAKQAVQESNHEGTTRDQQTRPPLGTLSPNTKINAPGIELLKKKPMTSSPLKRSFTASVDDRQGFTYLKKRKFSGEEPDLQGEVSHQPTHGIPTKEVRHTTPGSYTITPSQSIDRDPTPTEPNTPSDNGDSQCTQGSSVERASFSSWINYDPSSQQQQQQHQSSAQIQPQPRHSLEQLGLREDREDLVAKASLLRARLQLAMYKVRTNQVSLSFTALSEVSSGDATRISHQRVIDQAVAALRLEAQRTAPLHDRLSWGSLMDFGLEVTKPDSNQRSEEKACPSSPPLSHQSDEVETPRASQRAVASLAATPRQGSQVRRLDFTPARNVTSDFAKG
ncbi:hypothetical protein K431DRAFT_312734 [Polychaeton citri CBS 116435]|uniref:Uncharacterized protein n=1 Tax=Polychaeton citri CBS 116435 TaxID=1314669 RepID=A0A9P4UMH3_9PEZI|nr:hypothetical protein K431DRAFT_312734 [Polychaeton citri CBS 116435]